MTSGFQGFRRAVITDLLQARLLSTAHFYQTEIRHLLRHRRLIEVPIHYRAPSPRVSQKAVANSLSVLAHYTALRLTGRSPTV
jgi:dolichol-phosphate mannosyltransferase